MKMTLENKMKKIVSSVLIIGAILPAVLLFRPFTYRSAVCTSFG